MRTTFISQRVESSGVTTFYFQKPTGYSYIAGQFIELRLALPPISMDRDRRWFTLSSSPTEEHLSITTRTGRTPLSDFKQALLALQPNQAVHITEPMGDFVLPKDQSIPLVYIAAGIGITPFRSMVRYLLDSKQQRTITLIYGISGVNDQLFTKIFSKYGCTTHLIPTTAPHGWDGDSGSLNATLVKKLLPAYENARVFLAGPEPLVEVLTKDLLNDGYNELQLVTDYFPGYSSI